MSFNIITPIRITNARMIFSSIPEPDDGEELWDENATYDTGDRAYKADTHILYESLIDSNSGNDPALEIQNEVENPPTKWLEIGRTNRWQMFNLMRNNQSITESPLNFVIQPNTRVDSLGFFGMDANQLDVNMTVDGDVVYEYSENLNTRDSFTYYDYCYAPFSTKRNTILLDVPPITEGVISVTITSEEGPVRLGSFVAGTGSEIGDVQYGAESDVLNFSRIDRAFDGSSLLLPRRSVPKIDSIIFSNKDLINRLRNLRQELNAVPAVYVGLDQVDDPYFEPLLILGIYKKFRIRMDYPEHILTEIEVEEI
jgi:hypothetical protein